MSLIEIGEQSRTNPLDVVERLAATNDWSFERAGDDEITILVRGKWTDYQVSFTWMFDIEALHLACAFELKVPERWRPQVQQLISLINEQLWVGHFDLWTADGIVMYRHALVLEPRYAAVLEPQPSRELSALTGRGLRLNPAANAAGDVAAIVIALKPQIAPEVIPTLAPYIGAGTVAVSIMAGRTLDFLEQ